MADHLGRPRPAGVVARAARHPGDRRPRLPGRRGRRRGRGVPAGVLHRAAPRIGLRLLRQADRLPARARRRGAGGRAAGLPGGARRPRPQRLAALPRRPRGVGGAAGRDAPRRAAARRVRSGQAVRRPGGPRRRRPRRRGGRDRRAHRPERRRQDGADERHLGRSRLRSSAPTSGSGATTRKPSCSPGSRRARRSRSRCRTRSASG